MRKTLTCGAALLLVCSLAAGTQQKQYLRALEILPDGAQGDGATEPIAPKRLFELTGRRATTALEVGEVVEGREVLLHARPA
jgi:hypothetical protein